MVILKIKDLLNLILKTKELVWGSGEDALKKKQMPILKIKDLAKGDLENKGVMNFDLENKELSYFSFS